MIKYKPGVTSEGLRDKILKALVDDIAPIFDADGYDTIITSARYDYGGHVEHSGHYRGDAIDLRARHIDTPERQQAVYKAIKRKLGKHFFVLLHGEGPSIHYHIEWRPKFGGK